MTSFGNLKKINEPPSASRFPEPQGEASGTSNIFEMIKEKSGPFWILRGVVSSAALIGVIAEYIDIPKQEVARIILAIFLTWNRAMSELGKALSNILPIPPLSSKFINSLVIFSAVIFPFFLKIYRQYIFERQQSYGIPSYHFVLAIIILISFPFINSYLSPADYLNSEAYANNGWIYEIFVLVISVAILLGMIIFLFYLDVYFREAVIYLISFVIMAIAAYVLPFAREPLKAYADEVLKESSNDVDKSGPPGN